MPEKDSDSKEGVVVNRPLQPRDRKPNATLRHVAELAGVSRKTVSRVINGEPYVTAETLKKVQEAVEELSYVPNIRAKWLRRGRSLTVSILYPSTAKWEPSGWLIDIQNGAIEKADELGYSVLMQPYKDMTKEEQQRVMRRVEEGCADGLIALSFYGGRDEFTQQLYERGIPLVAIAPPAVNELIPTISSADRTGVFELTQHLIRLGHRRIGFIVGTPRHRSSEERLAGYREALERYKIPYVPSLVVQGNSSFEAGVVSARILLRQDPRPTAICACTDDAAAGVLQVAHQAGLVVPDDLSVTGHDDISWSRKLTPPLTTVHQPMKEIAGIATEILVRLIEGHLPQEPMYRELSPTVVMRESTGPPR